MRLKNYVESVIVVFVFIILKIALYLLNKEGYFVGEFSTYRYLIVVSLILYFLYQFRQESKNLGFKEVFLFTFISIIGIGFCSWLIDILIYNYWDNGWLKDAVEIEYQAQKSELESMNATGSLDREAIEQDMIKEHSTLGLLKSFIFSIPFSAIFSFFIGMLFQSRKED